jgi:hypothetical protein
MRKRLPVNRYFQLPTVREVRLAELARIVILREVDFPWRTFECSPALDPTLQRSHLAVAEAAWFSLLQILEERFGLQTRLNPQPLFDLIPNLQQTDPDEFATCVFAASRSAAVALAGICALFSQPCPPLPPPLPTTPSALAATTASFLLIAHHTSLLTCRFYAPPSPEF